MLWLHVSFRIASALSDSNRYLFDTNAMETIEIYKYSHILSSINQPQILPNLHYVRCKHHGNISVQKLPQICT